jgi:hypothetical protein
MHVPPTSVCECAFTVLRAQGAGRGARRGGRSRSAIQSSGSRRTADRSMAGMLVVFRDASRTQGHSPVVNPELVYVSSKEGLQHQLWCNRDAT